MVNSDIFRTEPQRQLRKGVDAWPRLSDANTPTALQVNAKLTHLNARMQRQLIECDADYRHWLTVVHDDGTAKAQMAADWSRKVEVTMLGPRYLSLVASDEIFCGGVHPNSSKIALVFDMTTGSPVNWMAMLDKRAGAKPYSDTVSDGSTAGALIVPALHRMSVASADADCKDAFPEEEPFLLWPDAKRGSLVAIPFDLPHVVQACGHELDLTMAQARQIGFTETLLSAIEQAHHANH